MSNSTPSSLSTGIPEISFSIINRSALRTGSLARTEMICGRWEREREREGERGREREGERGGERERKREEGERERNGHRRDRQAGRERGKRDKQIETETGQGCRCQEAILSSEKGKGGMVLPSGASPSLPPTHHQHTHTKTQTPFVRLECQCRHRRGFPRGSRGRALGGSRGSGIAASRSLAQLVVVCAEGEQRRRKEEGGRREEGGGRRAEGTQASSENVKQNRVSDLQTHTHTEISLPSGHTNDLVD
jgi:hypothetical protein